MPEPCGPGIGGRVAHASGQGAAGPGTGGGFSRQPTLTNAIDGQNPAASQERRKGSEQR